MAYNMRRIRKHKSLSSDLRHKIHFQNCASSSDGEGGFIEGWVDFTETWAAISPIKSIQKMDYESISAEVTHIVKVRGNVPCNSTQRIRFGKRYLEILTIPENYQERDILKILTCKELSR